MFLSIFVFVIFLSRPLEASLPTTQDKTAVAETILDLPWGSGGMMLGRIDGNESLSVGPMSFTLSPAGDLYILDQVNFRIMKFYADGSPAQDITIPTPDCIDIGIGGDGSIVLLDRIDRQSIMVLDEQSGAYQEYGVLGKGITKGGFITSMFVEDDGVWLEYEHRCSVRVLDASLHPVDRTIVPGRNYDGSITIGAELVPPGSSRIWLQDTASGTAMTERFVDFDHNIHRIIWVDRDSLKNIYAVFHLAQFSDQEPYPVIFEQIRGVRFDGKLVETGSFTSPAVKKEWWYYKEFIIDKNGSLYQMVLTEPGVKILRWRWK